MRLTQKEAETIRNSILAFDSHAEIYLFGSRVNDSLKGGDIDILIISETLSFKDKIKILTQIFKVLEEQKIDIIIKKDKNDVFVETLECVAL